MKLLNALDAFDELVDFGKLIVAAPFMITTLEQKVWAYYFDISI